MIERVRDWDLREKQRLERPKQLWLTSDGEPVKTTEHVKGLVPVKVPRG
jgi:hypothetical protein